jgi:protein SCO1
MNSRSVRILLVMSAFIAGFIVCFGVILLITGRGPGPIAQTTAAVGGPFELTDQEGRTVTDRDLKGHPFLVFFGFTNCPDVCPTTLFEVSEILRALGPDAGKVNALFVTVDPERDTSDQLKDYLSSFDPHMRALTGSPAAISSVAKAYRVYFRKVPQENGYTMDHTAIVYLMDKDGRFVAPFNVKRSTAEAVTDLRKYL